MINRESLGMSLFKGGITPQSILIWMESVRFEQWFVNIKNFQTYFILSQKTPIKSLLHGLEPAMYTYIQISSCHSNRLINPARQSIKGICKYRWPIVLVALLIKLLWRRVITKSLFLFILQVYTFPMCISHKGIACSWENISICFYQWPWPLSRLIT